MLKELLTRSVAHGEQQVLPGWPESSIHVQPVWQSTMQLLASLYTAPPPVVCQTAFLLAFFSTTPITAGLATCSPMFLQCFGHGRPHATSKGKPTRGSLAFLALALGLRRDIRHITAKMQVALGMHTHLEAYAKQKLPDANQKYGRLASPKPGKAFGWRPTVSSRQ